MNIFGDSIILRAIESDDVDVLHRWSNDPEVQQNLGGWHFPLSRASMHRWIDTFKYDGIDQRFVIEGKGTGPVGLITLTNINWKDRNAFHGVLIGEGRHRRKGFAEDAVRTIMRYAFEEMGLERLDTTIVEFNSASLKLHVDKCGWIEEGRKANAVFRKGKFWSLVILGATRHASSSHLGKAKAVRIVAKR
ncbi:MAG: GNAT family protein [Betaproteobacteria bacterium]